MLGDYWACRIPGNVIPAPMQYESIRYDPRAGYPLILTAKRYWIQEFEVNKNDPTALTLIFLHATSFHKETWEPTVEEVFKLAVQPNSKVKIREAWCLDCPNHGESGPLNAKELLKPEYYLNFTCEKYAQAVHHFLDAGPDYGAKIDFRKRNLVGIGHSLGGNAMAMVQSLEPLLLFSSIMVVEPMLSPDGPDHLKRLRSLLIAGAYERRDVWPSIESARVAMKKRGRTYFWDPRVLDIFVKHGLGPHPGAEFKDSPYLGLTLRCTRDQEAAMYRDPEGATKPVLDLNKASKRIPVHLVLGEKKDFMPERTHRALVDPKADRKFASITTIADAGHLLVQEVPTQLAHVIFENLKHNEALKRSKL